MAEIHKWHGLRELEENLLLLGREVHERGVKRMMSRAAVPMRDDAKQRAPILKKRATHRIPGTLRKHIAIWRKRDTPYAATYYVGVRGISKKAASAFKKRFGKTGAQNVDDPFFWRFVEFGTSKMRAQPFLRPAFEAKKLEAVRVALSTGQEFLRRTLKKLKRARTA